MIPSSLCLSRQSIQLQMKAELFTPQSLRSFQALPFGGHDILLCLCTCVSLKTCNLNLQQTAGTVAGIARTHKITSGITNSASVTLACTFALPSIFSSLTSFSFLVSSQSRSLLHLSNFLCLSLLPISWQVFFSSSVVCFGPPVLCLSVILFHAVHFSPKLPFPLLLHCFPIIWLSVEASLREKTSIFQIFFKSFMVL